MQFLLSTNQADSSINVLFDLNIFTRPVFTRYIVPSIMAAGTTKGHLTTSGKNGMTLESDSDSSNDDGDDEGQKKKARRKSATAWRLPIRRRNSLSRGKNYEQVNGYFFCL